MIRRELSTTELTFISWASALLLAVTFLTPQPAGAQMGECVDCHTMHNSQGALPMRYDSSSTPLPQLLRGDCFGCHAQGLPNAIVTAGSSRIPQVYHTDFAVDLAGGNFAYIDGTKGGAASDAKGHNIALLAGMGADATLPYPQAEYDKVSIMALAGISPPPTSPVRVTLRTMADSAVTATATAHLPMRA